MKTISPRLWTFPSVVGKITRQNTTAKAIGKQTLENPVQRDASHVCARIHVEEEPLARIFEGRFLADLVL